jgi:hypothetical protein
MTDPKHGMKKAVAVKCDEEREDGTWGHTWDVWVDGAAVQSGYRTREEARAAARAINEREQKDA